MKKVITGCFVVATLAFTPFVKAADTATGSLSVTGTVASSITLTVENGSTAGATVTGAGSNAGSFGIGTFSKYGTAPAGTTITPGSGSWVVASSVGVNVLAANSPSTTYTLNAKLGSTAGAGYAWTAGGMALSATDAVLTTTGAYGTAASYPWTITIQDTATAAAIDNTIDFTASAN